MKESRNLTIAIDGRNLMHPPSGNATYLICALNELSAQRPDWVFYLLVNRPLHPECAQLLQPRPNVQVIRESYTRIGLLWYCTQLYLLLKRLQPDYFWAPATLLPPVLPKGVKSIVTVNDMVPKDYRETMSFFNRTASDLFFDRSIRTADILLAISGYTAREIERRYPERRSGEITVGCGIDETRFHPAPLTPEQRAGLCSRYGIAAPFILFVGTLEPRKNLAFMLRLMPGLAADGFSLLVVGARGWGDTDLVQITRQPGYPSDRVVFSGYVPNEELPLLYQAAAVYVSTSLNEGFGLPQLEAMNCGCPVVSPHNSAMIEVVEGAGTTVTGWDVTDWRAAIRSTYIEHEHYRKLGRQRAEQFRWHTAAAAIARRLDDHEPLS